jgi:hypothetical protein
MKTTLKVALSAVALAALVAAPAVAKSRTQQQPTQAPAYSNNTVVQDGQVVGVDPDSYIRHEILRDNNSYRE